MVLLLMFFNIQVDLWLGCNVKNHKKNHIKGDCFFIRKCFIFISSILSYLNHICSREYILTKNYDWNKFLSTYIARPSVSFNELNRLLSLQWEVNVLKWFTRVKRKSIEGNASAWTNAYPFICNVIINLLSPLGAGYFPRSRRQQCVVFLGVWGIALQR